MLTLIICIWIISLTGMICCFVQGMYEYFEEDDVKLRYLFGGFLSLIIFVSSLLCLVQAGKPSKEQQIAAKKQYDQTLESLIGKKIKTIDSSGYRLEIVTENDGRIIVTGYKGITPRFQEAK